MRRLRWAIPFAAVAIFLFSVGLASANMTGTLLDTSTGVANGDAFQLVPAENQLGIRKGYRETFSTSVTGSEDDDPFQVVPIEKDAGTRKGYVGVFTSSTVPTTGVGVSSDFTSATTGAAVFTLTTKKGEEIVIHIPEGGLEPITKVRGGPAVAGVLEDGARVAVLVEFVQGDPDVVREARMIVVKPVPQTPINGAVASMETDGDGVRTLTIVGSDGTTEEVELGPDVATPAIGEVVIGFRGRGAGARRSGGRGKDNRPAVRGLVRADAVHERLQGILEKLGTEGEGLPDNAAEQHTLRVEQVGEILEKHSERNVEIIENLGQKQDLSPREAEAVAEGLDKAKAAKEKAKAAREERKAAREERKAAREEAKAARDESKAARDKGKPSKDNANGAD